MRVQARMEPLEGRSASILDCSHLKAHFSISPSQPKYPDLHYGLASSGSFPGRPTPAFFWVDSCRLPQPWALDLPTVHTSPPTGRCQDRWGNLILEGRETGFTSFQGSTPNLLPWRHPQLPYQRSLERDRSFMDYQEEARGSGQKACR